MERNHTAIIAAAVILLSACKKDEEAPPGTPAPGFPAGEATIRLGLDLLNGMQPFSFDQAFTDGAGNTIRFTKLKFYVSDIHLMDDDSNEVAEFHDTYLLVDGAAPTQSFELGTMPAGHVHEVHMTLGLDSATNYADPLVAPYPLDQPDMHWSWNPSSGYKFLNMEGYVDVDQNGNFDPTVDITFTYHCAQNVSQGQTAPVLRQRHIHIHADVAGGTTVTLEAKVDMAGLLVGLDLAANAVAMGNGANNQVAMDNLSNSIVPQ